MNAIPLGQKAAAAVLAFLLSFSRRRVTGIERLGRLFGPISFSEYSIDRHGQVLKTNLESMHILYYTRRKSRYDGF